MPLIGYKQSLEHKEKLRILNTGRPHYKRRGILPKNLFSLKTHKKGKENPHFGTVFSFERRKKMSEARKGERHWNWKGGISAKNKTERQIEMHSFAYKLWRQSVFERDNYTCIWCGDRSREGNQVTLHADHIKPWLLYPDLRLSLENGRTLCFSCHKTTLTYGYKIKKLQ